LVEIHIGEPGGPGRVGLGVVIVEGSRRLRGGEGEKVMING